MSLRFFVVVWLTGAAAFSVVARAELSYFGSASIRFENNPWLFSDQERADFRENPNQRRFVGVDSLNDFALTPYVSVTHRHGDKPRWRYRGALSARRYVRNERLDSESVYFEVRRQLSGGRHLKLFADYTPEEFVGESSGGGFTSREFVSHVTVGGNYLLPVTKRDRLLFSVRYGRDNYTDAFDDQDSNLYVFRAALRHRWNKRWAGRAEFWLRRRESGTLTAVVSDRAEPVVLNDISSNSYRADAVLSYRLNRKTTVAGRLRFVRKRYTTGSEEDTRHFGRTDKTYLARLHVGRTLGRKWDVNASVTYFEKNTNVNPGSFSYANFVTSFGLGYSF